MVLLRAWHSKYLSSSSKLFLFANRIPIGIVDKLSSRQLLDFIRSEGKGEFLPLILVLRCSMHMFRCLSMPSMPYFSAQMPIKWKGLSMPPDRCSVCMSIVIINCKLRGTEQDSVLTHIPVECWVVDPHVYTFLNGSGQAMVHPPYDGEVIRVGAISLNVAVSIEG